MPAEVGRYLKRLLKAGASYQAAELAAKALALLTLPIYTRQVSSAGYGAYQALFTAVILASIVVRAGLGEAFVRLYFTRSAEQRRQLARTLSATTLLATTALCVVLIPFRGPISAALLGHRHPLLFGGALLGLWAFTNLEVAYAQLRVEERTAAYLRASSANVALTIALTLGLVVGASAGAKGLIYGNFAASAAVVIGLWLTALRGQLGLLPNGAALRELAAFGLPTVPAEALLYGLQVADRFYLYRAYSPSAAGQYSVALQLATVVFVVVRGFQYAWPPLAYSIEGEGEALALYARVTTYLVLTTGAVVCAVALLGRYLVKLFAAPQYFPAHKALPFLALAWLLYGVYMAVLVIPGRARATIRLLPAAAAGLAVDVVGLVLLVPKAGLGLGLAGAAIALCLGYAALLATLVATTRRLLPVQFEWRRLGFAAFLYAAVAVVGDLLLPTGGVAGPLSRALWLVLLLPGLLVLRIFTAEERRQLRRLLSFAGGLLS